MSTQDDLTSLDAAELERRVAEIKQRMRPVEEDLAALRGQRDQLETELRRRRRLDDRTARAGLKASMRDGKVPTVAELVAGSDTGSLDDYVYNLKTGGIETPAIVNKAPLDAFKAKIRVLMK